MHFVKFYCSSVAGLGHLTKTEALQWVAAICFAVFVFAFVVGMLLRPWLSWWASNERFASTTRSSDRVDCLTRDRDPM
jgi:hypothetical protein